MKQVLAYALVSTTIGSTVAFLGGSQHANVGPTKHLVFMAGPRRSDSVAVDSFFQKHATAESSNGLNGWLWPQINETLPGEKYRYFENFFWSTHNATIQEILMQSIQDAWSAAEHGIILGAEGFDNTRGDPHSAGLKTMHQIVDALQVPPEQVHVVMVYKSPRLNQWISLFHHNAIGDGSYKEFICEESYSEHLASIPMNPFMLASVYRQQGWNVATVDVMGVHQKGLDLAHSVACQVLPKVECQNDTIVSLENEGIEEEAIQWQDFKALPPTKENELEGMFQSRDCYYREALEADAGFSIVHQTAVWEECGTSEFEQQAYQLLANDEHFFKLIQTQAGCKIPRKPATHSPREEVPLYGDNVQVDGVLSTRELTLLCASLLVGLFVMYQVIARIKRRQTHYVKSPRSGESVWVDFANDAFRVDNLRGTSSDDGSFTDVDLQSPGLKRSPRHKLSEPTIAEVAKEGRSVRGMYRVGLYQNSPTTKNRPQKGDSDFEFKIKSLEQEFA